MKVLLYNASSIIIIFHSQIFWTANFKADARFIIVDISSTYPDCNQWMIKEGLWAKHKMIIWLIWNFLHYSPMHDFKIFQHYCWWYNCLRPRTLSKDSPYWRPTHPHLWLNCLWPIHPSLQLNCFQLYNLNYERLNITV